MKRGLIIAALPLVLGGCLPVLPPAIQLASTGMSGIAYLATGKSTTDHLISAATEEDCSVMRMAFGDQPCRKYEAESEKPLTEIVAFYPGDRDDWIDSASIPEGQVSGKTILTVSTDGGQQPLDSWPGAEEPEVLLVEKTLPEMEPTVDETIAQPEPVGGLDVFGFAPASVSELPAPIKLTSLPADESLSVSDEESWSIDPMAPPVWRASSPLSPDLDKNGRQTAMPVLPVLRPEREPAGTRADATPIDHFVMVGSFREKQQAVMLQNTFASKQTVPVPAPVIMSVQLKGSLWHRVALGPFNGRDAVQMASSLEPVFGKTPWAAKVPD